MPFTAGRPALELISEAPGIWIAGATVLLQIANDAGKGASDRNLEMLAAGWTAAHTTQAAAAGLHTLRCNEALAAAATAIRKDAGAFNHAVKLAAATEERLLAPTHRSRGSDAATLTWRASRTATPACTRPTGAAGAGPRSTLANIPTGSVSI